MQYFQNNITLYYSIYFNNALFTMIYLIDAKNVVLDCYPAVSNHDNLDFIKQILFGQINGTSEIPQQSQIKSSYIERIGLIMYIR